MDRSIIGHFESNTVSAANKGNKVYLFLVTKRLQVVERRESPCRICDARPGANSFGNRAPQRTIWLLRHGRLTLPAREAWHVSCSARQKNSMLHKQLSSFPEWLPVWTTTQELSLILTESTYFQNNRKVTRKAIASLWKFFKKSWKTNTMVGCPKNHVILNMRWESLVLACKSQYKKARRPPWAACLLSLWLDLFWCQRMSLCVWFWKPCWWLLFLHKAHRP